MNNARCLFELMRWKKKECRMLFGFWLWWWMDWGGSMVWDWAYLKWGCSLGSRSHFQRNNGFKCSLSPVSKCPLLFYFQYFIVLAALRSEYIIIIIINEIFINEYLLLPLKQAIHYSAISTSLWPLCTHYSQKTWTHQTIKAKCSSFFLLLSKSNTYFY